LQIGNTLKVPVTGKVTGSEEKEAIIRVAEENHFSPGKYVEQFEHEFAKFIGKRYALFVNSGSSANLLAVAGFKKYSELVNRVFLPAVTFPTTIKFIINQELKNSNIVTENSFYIGCWHGLSEEQIEYTINVFDDFIEDIYG